MWPRATSKLCVLKIPRGGRPLPLSPSHSKGTADGWNRKWAVSLELPPCLCWGFVASSVEFCQHTISLLPWRELKVNANFISYVYSTLSLGYPLSTGACNLARGCQGRWFFSHWHPLVEENTGRILLLRRKIRVVFFERRGVSFQASAMLLLICP